MTKYFCDFCGTEITDSNTCAGGFNSAGRLGTMLVSRSSKVTLKVEILTSMDDKANTGAFCKHCVIDAIKKLDDRPTEAKRSAK